MILRDNFDYGIFRDVELGSRLRQVLAESGGIRHPDAGKVDEEYVLGGRYVVARLFNEIFLFGSHCV